MNRRGLLLACVLIAACVDPMPKVGDAPRGNEAKPSGGSATPRDSGWEAYAHRLEEENERLRQEVANLLQLRELADASPTPVEPVAEAPVAPIEQPAAPAALQVMDARSRITESNKSWWRYAWRVAVANPEPAPQEFRLEVEFVDHDGFTIDSDTSSRLLLGPGESRTFSGDDLVSMPAATRVFAVRAKIVQ